MSGIYWLASYPKSGNTWFRIFLENLLADGEHPADINRLSVTANAAVRHTLDVVLGFASADLSEDELAKLRPAIYGWKESGASPARYLKIHDAYSYSSDGTPLVSLEGTLGALYMVRNPLDIAPSLANHFNIDLEAAVSMLVDATGTLLLSRGRLFPQVRQQLLCWSRHVLSWVDAPSLACHVIRYEDMLCRPLETFTGAARFLRLPDEPLRIAKALRFSDFSELVRQENSVGFRERATAKARFFNQGRSGQGRLCLSAEQVRRIVDAHGPVMERFGYLDEGV